MDYKIYFENAVKGSRTLHLLDKQKVNAVLDALANRLVEQTEEILAANLLDLERMSPEDPKYDRLKLSTERIAGIAGEVRNIAALESPLSELISENTLPNGLHLSKLRVPLGVIGVIYEARPNVTIDVFSLCFKTGNTAVLKGGSDAEHSNQALIKIIHQVLAAHEVDINVAVLLPAEREATAALLNAVGMVDVLIPRGSHSLITYVRDNSRVPVIETGAGIVHTYFDISGDKEKGADIVFNAKTRRVSVCNSLDCLLIHAGRLADLYDLVKALAKKSVIIYADEQAYAVLKGLYPADLLFAARAEDFGIEFLDYKMAIKTVADTEEALAHIAVYSSKHSEAIVTEDEVQIVNFLNAVDAAAVYANASTAFTDGAQFGLGAEIGISTQKLHARGPMGLAELTTYKWVIRGQGQTRN
ncbi:glutamate-5-semialdehyde dehydrogenase [Pedobacter sp. MC2016-14]|uniref:glutamate-5-semialdehyde dehydrogenase n=1 Tax=Pedobacter sp. MC2016-14 TaxID=2897327 RepID=UPI001E5AE6A5|nr:glutamate-5-semialdehyde dehydrogenase [Pedobacter sp. MC2016-14]MCD0488740.1 glutamate-5-semialdehyde dehydrogenase [Pedobacter sp. MC2016-14]